MSKILMKGNEALAEAAVRAGCRYYFGYPITPQNEIPAYMSWRLPEVGGVFVQAESETASINMLFGAGSTGARAMTSSSSPGVSLMQEGISFIAGAEVPCVLVNMMRGGPGLGNISPSQADYNQSVKRGGHGDYRVIVIAPHTVQEVADLTAEAFDISQKYCNPVMILGDGILGQISEPVEFPELRTPADDVSWAVGSGSGKRNVLKSLYLVPDNSLELHNWHLIEKYERIEREFCRYEEYRTEDAEYICVGYGTTARILRAVVDALREQGVRIGLFRPITLWPFPRAALRSAAAGRKAVIVAEMAYAQLEEDVRMHLEGTAPVKGFYTLGGAVFNDEDLARDIRAFIGESK